jgi:peptidoglycan hydrolase-like protein with peptidoglycan-binding domain
VKAIQSLLRELKFYRDALDGDPGPATRAAIREYQRAYGEKETGEPSKALFDSLQEKRAPAAPKPG